MNDTRISVTEQQIKSDVKNTYKSCCLLVDKRALQFFSQLGISLVTIVFSIYKLSVSDTCETDSLYSGILMLVVGTWLPAPAMKS
jgi:hypothetical protein